MAHRGKFLVSTFFLLVAGLIACGGTSPSAAPPIFTPNAVPAGTGAGFWDRVVQIGQSQVHDNVTVTVHRVGVGTPKGLLPNFTPEDLKLRGLDNAISILAVVVKVDNKTGKDIRIYPGGVGALLLVGDEQSESALFASQIGGELMNGALEEFQVLFPLKRTSPDAIHSFRYKFEALGHEFNFEINLHQ